jgi:2,4-dienoyl-CoA reductase-like NADH-dependent reductase (Old Yellow Enzyme family)
MSADPPKIVRLATLKSPAAFRDHAAALGIRIPCDEVLTPATASPLVQPLTGLRLNGRTPGNRLAIHPMEGWDGTTSGGVTDDMRRRWRRFGESGAKLVCGGEAMAVRPDGRANPNQLILSPENRDGIAELVALCRAAHREHWGDDTDLAIGFQLTHSGRFCRPHSKEWESRVAYRHPLLDRRFNVTSDTQVLSDDDMDALIAAYVSAARIAREAGADFIDIKHCHGYLLHEFLGAHTRPGRFGGSFENRTRPLRDIVAGLRADGNPIDVAVRLSLFDMVPHRPDPERSQPGKLGPGIPEDFSGCLPYRYGFGVCADDPRRIDLTESHRFIALCAELGIRLINATAGSPYYTPHIQRPAAFPPSDGYQPAYDPLIDVARQMNALREINAAAPDGMVFVGTGYSYLQEHLPAVAQAAVRDGWTDVIGLGRMALSYPRFLMDAVTGTPIESKLICRTFSDCTTAPRNGLPSGCYPLDSHYTTKPEHTRLKELKRPARA